jgi:hypothetical protein
MFFGHSELKKIIETYTWSQEDQLEDRCAPDSSESSDLNSSRSFTNGPNRLMEQKRSAFGDSDRRHRRKRHLFDTQNSRADESSSTAKEQLWPLPIFDILNLVPSTLSSSSHSSSSSSSSSRASSHDLAREFLSANRSRSSSMDASQQSNRGGSSSYNASSAKAQWTVVGNITSGKAILNTLTFISGNYGEKTIGPGPSSKHNFR